MRLTRKQIEAGLIDCMNNKKPIPLRLRGRFRTKKGKCPTCGQPRTTKNGSYLLPSWVDDCDCGGWRVQDEFGEKVPLRCLKCGRKWDAEGKEVV